MADDKPRLLKVKATLKKRQPKFIRQDAHKHKRVKQVWRSPKGLHSKMRDSRKGYRAKLQGGYQTPKEVRGLDKHGLKPTLVAGAKALEALDPKVHSIILQKGLGGKKRLEVLEHAAKHKFTVLNAKPDAAEKIKARLNQQHAEKKARDAAKSEKQKAAEAKAAKKDEKSAEEKDDEQKKQDAEKHKTLHKKE